MPVDMDHALDRRNRSEAPAAGWIEELAARENGIWARIAWTPTGRAKIEGRECRFISPVVMVTKAGEVMAIRRAGLTNAPAIAMVHEGRIEAALERYRQGDPCQRGMGLCTGLARSVAVRALGGRGASTRFPGGAAPGRPHPAASRSRPLPGAAPERTGVFRQLGLDE